MRVKLNPSIENLQGALVSAAGRTAQNLGSADALAFATVVLHGRLEQVVASTLDDWQR